MKIGDRVIIKKLSVNGILLPHNGEVVKISRIIRGRFQIEEGCVFKEIDLIPLYSVIDQTIKLGKYIGKIDYTSWGFFIRFNDHASVCYELKKDQDFINIFPNSTTGLFPETKNYFNFIQKVQNYNQLKTKQNETKLQREETSVRGGEITEGHRICCRQYKTTIRRGHLDNKAWNLRSGERIKRNQDYLPF